MKEIKKNKIIKTAIFIITALCFLNNNLNAQNTVKAEIKKPKPSLIGKWGVSMQISGDKKEGIVSYYVYNFLQDGKYEYQDYYWVNSAGQKIWSWRLIETGKWIITNDGKTLNLISDSIKLKRTQYYDLTSSQPFEQTSSSIFKIKRTSGSDTAEYIYLRKNYTYRRKDY